MTLRRTFRGTPEQLAAERDQRNADRYQQALAAKGKAQGATMVNLSAAVHVQIVKEVAAKPGKGAPTVLEKKWMASITAFGCIACYIDGMACRPGAVHHLVRGNRRIGHLFTICLCDPGHHQGGQSLGLVSRHPWKAQFEKRYGTELELLARTKALIGWKA